MDFLKSAVASAILKGPPFPYSFGDRVDVDQSIWTLHNGTKRVCRQTRIFYSRLTLPARKTAPNVAFSPSMSPPTSPACPWRAMRCESCAQFDIPALLKSSTPLRCVSRSSLVLAQAQDCTDRILHLHRDRAPDSVKLAHETEEPGGGDDKMGLAQCCCKLGVQS
jgi:SCY1-like protein 1